MSAPTQPGRIRIIGGQFRGSKLTVPISAGLRPTPDRVRETLFNWLREVINGAQCLDLFAGSGAVGIEALSRGAAAVTFIERETSLANNLRANLERLHASGAQVVHGDAMDYLGGTPQAYDVIFMDPPFALDLAPACALALEQGGWLSPQAMIYIELPADKRIALPTNWHVYRHGRAGALDYTVYQRSDAPSQ